MNRGILYLIPVPLAEGTERHSYTPLHTDVLTKVKEFIVENEKTARKFLKNADVGIPQNQLIIHDYGKHVRERIDYGTIFANINKGQDLGLMSEAGCPGVADPGADIVFEAHKRGIRVVPLVGPSSILLALMASGLNGQKFSFQGYLPIDKGDRSKRLKDLESQSSREKMTQLFIETPFRNNQMLAEVLKSCKSSTKLCVAANLTASDEFIQTKTVAEWRSNVPDLHKIPAIFLLLA